MASAQSNPVLKNRSVERCEVVLPTRCRSRTGTLHHGYIVDLSVKGCKLACETLTLQEGDTVVVSPQGLQGLRGLVRWVRKGEAGIAFEQPMYPPVVDHLVRQHGQFLRH